MLFNSLEFLVFLPVVLAVYYALPHRQQNIFLVLASCFFYASWDWRFLFPLLFSTGIDYFCAQRMAESWEREGPPAERKRYLVVSLVTNLGLLGFFKYFNFFAASLHDLLTALGLPSNPQTLEVILPVGISFYTFQALSYTIDVYRGQIHATQHFADFFLAVLYFPHLVAGPIQRAHNLIEQVIHPRRTTRQQVIDGLHLMVWGFFKKVFIADHLSPIVDKVFSQPAPSGGETLLAVYAFAVQIYCDFSGYTDIARGVAKIMGFEFMLNFNLPYFATSPQEFWTRWHISLSSWLRDYLYIPLGGNRGGEAQTRRNLMLTMVIGGFWHGAAWNFIYWGFYHGTLLVAHRLSLPFQKKHLTFTAQPAKAVWFLIRLVVMFHLTCYGWLLFRATSAAQIAHMTGELFRAPLAGWDPALGWQVLLYSLPLIVVQTIQYVSGKLEFLNWSWVRAEVRAAVYAVLLYLALVRGGTPQSFIYFQF